MVRQDRGWTSTVGALLTVLFLLALTAGFVLGGLAERDGRLSKVRRVADLIRAHYIESVEEQDLEEAAVEGLFEALDPHSAYYDAEAWRKFNVEHLARRFSGVGIRIESDPDTGQVRVVAPLEGSPALRAGIRPGDLILAVDGESVEGQKLDRVAQRIRGPQGTTVRLTILRGRTQTLEMELMREEIRLASVEARMLPDGVGYVRVREFAEPTPEEFRAALDRLRSEGSRALVLDLRFNTGGLLDAAIQVADEFLSGGRIVEVRGRTRAARVWEATPPVHPLLEAAPVAVLIHEGTASAGEVVAGCLRDHGRVRLFGTRTYGKGSVQDLIELEDGARVKLTTARYYLPSGRSVHREPGAESWGIDADVQVEMTPEEESRLLEGWTRGQEEIPDPVLEAALAWWRQGQEERR